MSSPIKKQDPTLVALQNAARYGMAPEFFTDGFNNQMLKIKNGATVVCNASPVYIMNSMGVKMLVTFKTPVEAIDHLKCLYHY